MPHRAKPEVIRNPNVTGGAPVIEGIRIPVHFVARPVEQGVSEFEIPDDYPSPTRSQK